MVGKLCLVMDHQRPLMPNIFLVLNRYQLYYQNCLNVGGTLYPEHFSKFTGIFWSESSFKADHPPFSVSLDLKFVLYSIH